jgi:flagellar basal-body rod protein FlgB
VLIDQLTNADAIPTLEAMVQFSGQRQKLIASNIANFDTPAYQPLDVSPFEFQRQLGEAVDQRRAEYGTGRGPLELPATREVEQTATGLKLTPRPSGRNVLFHDRNSRDLERTMQDLVENVATFRVASELLKSRVDLLRTAISERVT